ncbi:response regulator transcription factor [Rhabdobacter roseus]|uniref:Two-component system copper resistance phosphate regulon response regulator CusR n=1 Tax=Rhabdobacter roseus TaxID=1655419 RepID=A0A840TKB1_9BACT|nr:response regulator transcription factor [Rhabdobacter roseus]MBB5281992.1 two-component system copper resistance phosphate regulon response regulator CusR [Rhabdobacter roseus]
MVKFLLVEDDDRVASFIKEGLADQGFLVEAVTSGFEALNQITVNDYDVIILDIMLPDLDGYEVCKITRKRNIKSIIIILSALGDYEEKIKGLEAGADDYLAKPFHFRELLARINAQLRRKQLEKGIFENNKYADIEVDVEQNRVTRSGREINLSPREFNLLLYLLRNRERVLSRVEIAEAVWDIHFSSNTNVVEVYINYLRNKIDKDFDDKLIHTIKGRGYLLKQKAAHES